MYTVIALLMLTLQSTALLYESIITAWSKKENKIAEKNLREKMNEKYLLYMRTVVLN